jgi:hypothetical protein
MYDVNKIDLTTMGDDRHMVTVNGGWIVLESITREKGGVDRKE